MNLNQITANIRLRSTWEAIDLGFAMVQRWWKSLYLPLALLTFSIATVLYFIIPFDKIWLSSLIFWWLKPLYDRLILHILSHKLFNNELTTWQALKSIPSLIWNTGFFQSMTFRRFSLSRGFNLPIWQLEQLRGKERAERQEILHSAAHSQAIWLTVVMVHLEIFLLLSLFGLVFIFLPENMQKDFIDGILNQKVESEKWLDILNYIFYALVLTFLHPFYIAGNFALYINSRTQLEAWDIELDFKKLSKRLTSATQQIIPSVFIIALTIGLTFSTSPSFAKEINTDIEVFSESRLDASQSKKIIAEVMKTKNLDDKETTTRWIKKKKEKKEKTEFSNITDFLEPLAKIFSFIIEFGLWLLIGVGIILLFIFRDSWLHLLNMPRKKNDDYTSPEVMFGMDVRPESLPDDIIGEAQKLWKNTHHREALSLLYRGALVRLINQEKIRLENSYTEGDVLRHANKKLIQTKQSYLESLTQQWRLIAYAHRTPSDTDMQFLFKHWDLDFSIDDTVTDE